MNIAILDDSKEDLRQVKSVISSYYESQNTSADIHLYYSAEAFFTKYIPGFYDLIIMDIYMGSMTGMDAARKLREARDTAALIFISSSDSFAVESYDVQASYYLLKPFDPEKLCRILSTIQFRQSQNSRYIELISDRTPVKIPVRSILYVDTYRNAVQVHTTDAGIIRSYITFQKFEELLEGMKCFLSCYRGCIVNMDHVDSVDKHDFVMENGERVPITRGNRNSIYQQYADYQFLKINGGI